MSKTRRSYGSYVNTPESKPAFSFEKLVPEMILTIGFHSDFTSGVRLTQVSKSVHQLFGSIFQLKRLLQCVAYGDEVMANKILEHNPRLLLLRGNTIAPSGDLILDTTAFEFAIAACDKQMADMMLIHFGKMKNGKAEATNQHMKYKEQFAKMFRGEYDNFLLESIKKISDIMEIIKKSSNVDVRAALGCNITHESTLWNELEKLRRHFFVRKIKDQIHFPFPLLEYAHTVYKNNFFDLKNKSGLNGCLLFWNQVIGLVHRLLPACVRQGFSQGLDTINLFRENKRSFKFPIGGEFPLKTDHKSRTGLGYTSAGMDHFATVGSALLADDIKKYISMTLGFMYSWSAYQPVTCISTQAKRCKQL